MTLFERIKYFAKKRGMSLQQVALDSGLSKNAIYNWKNKKVKDVSEAYLIAIAKTLGITLEKLTDNELNTEPKKIDLKSTIDDDDIIMTFEGKEIPKEDLEVIKRLLRRD